MDIQPWFFIHEPEKAKSIDLQDNHRIPRMFQV